MAPPVSQQMTGTGSYLGYKNSNASHSPNLYDDMQSPAGTNSQTLKK